MRLPEAFSFANPLKINCGSHALNHLPIELAAFNANAPLILSNRDQIGRKGLKTVIDAFKTSGLALGIYDRLSDQPQPDLMPVLVRMYQDGGCDSIIVVGSGSVVDTAKCLNVMISADDHVSIEDSDSKMTDPGPLRPLMLVATVGGNGDEVTGYASDGVRRLRSPRLVPDVAFIDPTMMMAGRDGRNVVDGALIALVHAVEAFLDDSTGPMCRAYADAAIGLIVQSLPMALGKTDRKRSLCAVVNGQVAAGCAFFASSPGICHALAAQLKASTDIPPGLIMAPLLPHLIDELGGTQPERVGELLNPMVGADIFAGTAADLKTPLTVALFWEFFDAINAELSLKIPMSLGEAGLTDEKLEQIRSVVDGNGVQNHVLRIIDRARKGPALISG